MTGKLKFFKIAWLTYFLKNMLNIFFFLIMRKEGI